MDCSGSWELTDSAGLADCSLALVQDGRRVTGAAYYCTGAAIVEGVADADGVRLEIIYDNAKVLGRWLPRGLAARAVGVRSALWCAPPEGWDGAAPLPATYQGFYLTHAKNGGDLQLYPAGHPDLPRLHPPRLALLARLARHGSP